MSEKIKFKIGLLIFVLMVIFNFKPYLVKAETIIYAKPDATGTMDGSVTYPYKKISDAIKKADKGDKKVVLLPGTYTEDNITILNDVIVDGLDQTKVIIKSDGEENIFYMEDESQLLNVTVRKGDHGIEVEENVKALISNCIIEDNAKDGIYVKKANINKNYKITISNNIIRDNSWDGIYSEERYFDFNNNLIYDNNRNGIEFKAKATGEIKSNQIYENSDNGIKALLDGSKIVIKSNLIKKNNESGLSVNNDKGDGKFYLYKNKFYQNKQYGIERVKAENVALDLAYWKKNLKVYSGNKFKQNSKGAISK